MNSVVDGDSLRRVRAAHGWSQRELARRAHINGSIISRLERGLQGGVDVAALVALARALDIPVDTLIAAPGRQESGPLTHELAAEVTRLPELSVARQRHVAALLKANRIAFPEEDPPLEP